MQLFDDNDDKQLNGTLVDVFVDGGVCFQRHCNYVNPLCCRLHVHSIEFSKQLLEGFKGLPFFGENKI